MTEFLETVSTLRYVLIVGPIIGAMCAMLSVFVVLRRMSLISEGVSHAGFGGIAVALFLGYFFPPIDRTASWGIFWQELITGIFCLCTALLIGYVTRRKKVSEDAAIGIFLVATVAFGKLLLTVRDHFPGQRPVDVEGLLFGDFSSVDRTDTIVAASAAIIVFSIVIALYYQFLYTTLDEEMARVNGVNTGLVNTLLLMMVSLVIVVCVRMVGFLMITALTILPAATANMISRKFSGVVVFSLLIGTLGTFTAAFVSLFWPMRMYPLGPMIVLTLFGVFSVVWIFRRFTKPPLVSSAPIGPLAP